LKGGITLVKGLPTANKRNYFTPNIWQINNSAVTKAVANCLFIYHSGMKTNGFEVLKYRLNPSLNTIGRSVNE